MFIATKKINKQFIYKLTLAPFEFRKKMNVHLNKEWTWR